jgi:tetratricopeptide (TPR) repeat protein
MIVTVCIFVLLAQTITPEVIEHTQAGVEAQSKGDLDTAIREFQKAVDLSPSMASGYASLGAAYFKKGDYERAIPVLEKALELNPHLLGAEGALGVALLVQGDANAALPHLTKVREPELMGLAYLETGKLNDAIAALQVSLDQHPNDPDVLYYYGQATALASKKAFETIVGSDAGSARAHQVEGDRYFNEGKFTDAGREYLESIRLKPYTQGVHLALAHALAASGNGTDALVELRAEAQLRPSSAQVAYELGSALLDQGQARDALAELARAAGLAPNVPATLLALGNAALATGDEGRAEKSWTRLLEIEKQGEFAAQAHFRLAALYRKAGKMPEAEREMKQYETLNNAVPQH